MGLDNYFPSPSLTISVRGDDLILTSKDGQIPDILDKYHSKQNPSEAFIRFLPRDYNLILQTLENSDFSVKSTIKMDTDLPKSMSFGQNYELYDFQREAVDKWIKLGVMRGTIILPTGGGKSVLAIDIIRRMQVSVLIVVPTLVLFEQWKEKIE